ncbi:hypothetical protein ATO8_07316 [Roseivivax marinus]|jgi:hypothetical protein|uniref:Arginine transporter n=1 Tax=Roseivivax marinus TaxID=1379903 RepID=W4HP89_9RHOB|nr:hypothetical protein [Roseivivax marinus]ETW13820.1 hypothetical protein ATO8_07316 [Roseivivax marinus]UMA65402.1 arginine transporter [Roseivivax marinus]SEL64911.1 hypothetical protein SAMN05444413_112113 [Roseivivax marinus]
MKSIIMVVVCGLTLAACGQRESVSRGATFAGPSFASGPMKTACLRSDRKARNDRLCGCIQATADRSLSGAEQRLAIKFFKDPHHAQEIRQSDRPKHEEMWRNYKAFVSRAERSCRGL